MDAGNKIKQLRTNAELTQKDFGELFHVSDKTVSKWERDISQPDLETIQDIVTHFNVDSSYFFEDKKDDTVSRKFTKWMIVASCFLVPALILPLMPFILSSITNARVEEVVIFIYLLILPISTLASIMIIVLQFVTLRKINTVLNGEFYFNQFFLYIVLLITSFTLMTRELLFFTVATGFTFIYYLFPEFFYLVSFLFLFYLIKPLNLTFQHNKTAITMLVITSLLFLLFLITPVAQYSPWTKHQALVATILFLLIYTKITIKPKFKNA